MKPDRSNYEIWIIDWLDGNLSAERESLLMEFLADNPDIREEADAVMMARISPRGKSGRGWDNLKKSPADLTEIQIEYLSAAHLEKDLSPEQEAELMQSLESNPAYKATFEKIQKTKLQVPDAIFKNKARLKRVAPAVKILRISIISLSAAAVILFVFLNNLFVPRITENNILQASHVPDTFYLQQPVLIRAPSVVRQYKPRTPVVAIALPVSNNVITREAGPTPVETAMLDGIGTTGYNMSLVLISSTEPSQVFSEQDDRSNISKFLSRTFRKGILREKKVSDAPIQTYELAEAGIKGLNKLLGWQMALEKTADSAGGLKSLYFSSRMLKFNAPVRKNVGSQ